MISNNVMIFILVIGILILLGIMEWKEAANKCEKDEVNKNSLHISLLKYAPLRNVTCGTLIRKCYTICCYSVP